MMADLNKKYIFRITHIENIPHILEYGVTHANSANRNFKFVPIGDSTLINARSSFVLSNGRRLGEYIPFYFAVRTPMLYVIQKGFNFVAPTPATNIVYCVSTVAQILHYNLDFVFTDGHAVDFLSSLFTSDEVHNLDSLLDDKAIKAKYWKDEQDLDLKRRKEAEFLILNDVPKEAILGFVVYNEEAKKQLLTFGVSEKKVHINSNYYF